MTATRRRIADRKARALALGQREAAARCAFCKIALPAAGAVQGWSDNKRYCSEGCRDDAALFEQRKQL